MIELRVLGPVRVLAGGRDLEIGHARQRGLLALLLVDANAVVPFERLVELLWDEHPPRLARNVMAGYATRLRKVLASAPSNGGAPELSARDGGYVLEADPAAVDLCRFKDLAARGAAATGDDEQRSQLLRNALEQWSGAPLSDLWGTRVESLRATLEAQQRSVLTAFYDAQLRLGRAREILPELQWLMAERPYDEELMLRLMAAHRDSGNQAEALRQYSAFRERLASELAARPGRELREAGELLLQPQQARPRIEVPSREQLPMPAAPDVFSGREPELAALDMLARPRELDTDPATARSRNLFVISGLAGSGKTTLAVQWAQRARDSFPDGRFFVAMRGHHPNLEPLSPAETLARVLLALGLPAADIPYGLDERAALYRTLLARRRVLILLDDVAGPDQVRDLLPTSVNGSAVVVTGRNRMPELTVRYCAGELMLDVLDERAALALLSSLVGTERVAAEPDAAVGFVRASGQLPLTLRLSAAYAAGRPEESLARLLPFVAGAPGEEVQAHRAMRQALNLSYRRLAPKHRQVFRWAGLMPGSDFGTEAVAALADCSFAEAEDRLGTLVRANLVTEYASRRYRLHDMVKQYAAETAAEDPLAVREAALLRLLEWYRRCVEEASHTHQIQMAGFHRGAAPAWIPVSAPQEDGMLPEVDIDWLDREKANICAAIKHAAEMGLGAASWQLADAMLGFIRLHPGGEDWSAAVRAALVETAKSGDSRAHTGMLLNVADTHYRDGTEGELAHAREAVQVARDAGWRAGEALALTAIGRSYWSMGEVGLADRYLTGALRIHEDLGDWAGQANALARIARNIYDAGAMEDALRDYRRALVLVERAGSRFGRVRLPGYIALTLRHMGRYEEAERWCALAIRLSEEMSFHEGLAIALTCRATIHSDLGAQAKAVAAAREAHVTIPHLSDPRIETDCLIHLGGVEAAAEHTDQALRSFGNAWRIAEKFGYRQGVARALAESAAVHVRMGRYEEAVIACRRSRTVLGGTALRPVIAQTLMSEADSALASGRCAAAVAGYRRVAAIYRANHQPLGEVRALLAWSRAVQTVPGHGRPGRPAARGLRIAERLGVPEADSLRALV
ncbi:AfsR/SARP family transcriptional regulator [Actinacidiphila sp. ITFR-21]|uniref:AfsR/SARP family transcriptional regulator n=1 Tax=Actinacidiphila sp. ITFR-21 TaxID=3075199 RepID=UPI00288BEE8B|nr:BTAD domain-containing putative transcriptional regulator [Streptomyces sp. ITFR-21]WNI18003.1 BTAD domain-containing putative transcriptional regulator [Streptomyces sp. ITFR-21]